MRRANEASEISISIVIPMLDNVLTLGEQVDALLAQKSGEAFENRLGRQRLDRRLCGTRVLRQT